MEPFIDDGREELVDEPSLSMGPAFNIQHNNPDPLQESWEMHEMVGFIEEREMLVDDEDTQQDASHPNNDGYSLPYNGIPPPSVQNTSSTQAWLDDAAVRIHRQYVKWALRERGVELIMRSSGPDNALLFSLTDLSLWTPSESPSPSLFYDQISFLGSSPPEKKKRKNGHKVIH